MKLKPVLVWDEDKRVHMQVRLGQFTATMPLPEELATSSAEELQAFFDLVVPEMTKNLVAMKQVDQRKTRRKACGSGSTKAPRKS